MLNTIRPEIPKRRSECLLCQESFKPGHQVASWLYMNDEGFFARDDLCQTCFTKKEYQEKKESLIHWKVKVAAIKAKTSLSKSKNQEEMAYELFQKERMKEDIESKQKTFILSLFLARKKRLLLRSDKLTEKKVSYYEDVQTGELIEISVFQAHLIPVEEIKRELSFAIRERIQTMELMHT